MATIRQIAEMSGVSPTTASRVLSGGRARSLCSDSTIEHVERVARDLGYRVNYHMRSVRTGRSLAIGFSMDAARQRNAVQIGSWYFEQLREGVESEAQAGGMNLMIIRPDNDRNAFQRGVDYLADRRLDALVVPYTYAVRNPEAAAAAEGMNVVTADGPTGVGGFPHIGFDQQAGLTMLVEHLQSLGHRRVLWFGPAESEYTMPTGREQLLLREAFTAGLAGRVHHPTSAKVEPTQQIEQALGELQADLASQIQQIKDDHITAIVGYSDIYALAAERALILAGIRVPDEISVTGFDDSFAAFGLPPITTISHELFAIGQAAGSLANALVEARAGDKDDLDEGKPPHVASRIVEPRLVVRGSTGPAPK